MSFLRRVIVHQAPRGSGKTIEMMNMVVDEVGYGDVAVVSSQPRWCREMANRFREAGLIGVKFYTPQEVKSLRMRGYVSAVFVDDIDVIVDPFEEWFLPELATHTTAPIHVWASPIPTATYENKNL